MDRLPPLRLLVTFDAVHRLGSMRLAAGELNVTRPAVSQTIKTLEATIGVALFDRSAKPARLTEAGERLARSTRIGLGQIADTIEEIRLEAGGEGRHLTVSCTLGMATYWLMPRLSKFYARRPDTMVNVQAPPSDMPAFSTGIDIALRYGATRWTDGETFKLFDDQAYPAGRPEVIDRVAGHLDLRDAPLIHVRSPQGHHWPGWPDYFTTKAMDRPVGPRQHFDNYVQATQAALDGRGVLLGWRSITDALVADGRLRHLPDGACDFNTAYWVTCAWGSLRKPAAQDFLEWVRREIGPAKDHEV